MQELRKSRRRKRKTSKVFTILLLLVILVFFSIMFYLNIIPILFTILALVITLGITFLIIKCNFSRKKGFRLIGYFFSTIIIFIMAYILIYLFNTLGFLIDATNGDFTIKTYNVLVLKESSYNDITDLDNKNIGISETVTDDSLDKAKDKLSKKVKLNYNKYEDSNTLVTALYNKKIESIILEDSELSLLEENDYEKFEGLKVIYKIEIKNDIKSLKDAVNINKDTFNLFISGIDTYGKINSSSRSDVNILVTVNPKDEKILITWIPRDYYVNINKSKYKDKLTHAGMYGIDSSVYAIENLLDVNINYYVKVNFTSVIDIVDALEGITVYNDETFTTNENITFRKGEITLNGEKALSFVRDRKHVTGGDIGRGKNQIKVLEALLNKAMSPDIIKNYNKLINSLKGAFVTNMNQSAMLGFIKKEIQSPRDWQIESITLEGTNAYEYTYTYKNHKLYVMLPDEDMVNEVKEKIKSLNLKIK